MATMEAEHEKLLKLYELAINEEHHYLDAHQNRIDFYFGLLSALATATGLGFFQASKWYHLAFLCAAPALIFAVSTIAIEGTFHLYQRFLESVTVRAKIEQELALTSQQPGAADTGESYWQSEPLIPARHLGSRRKYQSSQAFIEAHATRGYHHWTVFLFRIFQGASIAIFLLLVCLTILKARGCA